MGFDNKKFKALVTSLALGALGAQGLLGCSSSDDPADSNDSNDSGGSGGSSTACVPGDQKACACPGGVDGVQICRADGGGYDACTGCGAPNPGTGGSSTSGGGTGGTSAGGTGNGGTGSACDGCPGCCDGTACVAPIDQSAAQCGPQGSMCATCNEGEICVAGECRVNTGECSPATCPAGCCYEGSCLLQADQSYLQCGGGGAECILCNPYGAACVAGSCTTEIDPNALFWIVVDSARLTEKNNGSDWDPLGGLPDPVVCFSAGGRQGCTTIVDNTSMPVWSNGRISNGNVPVTFEGIAFSGPVEIAVWDYDPADDDDLMVDVVYPSGIFELADEYVIENQGALLELRWHLE